MWLYRSSVGTFRIVPQSSGCYSLYIEGQLLGTYYLPQIAADDVRFCMTGYGPWDKQIFAAEPASLDDWDRPDGSDPADSGVWGSGGIS